MHGDQETVGSMIRYGNDGLWGRLQWMDRVYILDLANRMNLPFKARVFDNMAVSILLADYDELVQDLTVE